MNIRLDIENPKGKKPKLIGLWIKGFGWIVGGSESGKITIYGKIVPPQHPFDNLSLSEKIQIKAQAKPVKEFLARMAKWNLTSEGLWETK